MHPSAQKAPRLDGTFPRESTFPQRGQRPRIGILGGSGPEASHDLLGKVLRINRELLGPAYENDQDGPDVVLLSCPGIGGPRGHAELVPGNPHYERTWVAMSKAIRELAPMVDCFCICCNQLHCFDAQILHLLTQSGEAPEKFVSMIDATTDHCQSLGLSSLCIFGNIVTTDLKGMSPYSKMVGSMGNCVKQLSEEQRHLLKDLISDVKKHGPGSTRIASTFDGLLQDMHAAGTQGIVLACTELPLIPVPGICRAQHRKPPDIQLIDPTELLATALLTFKPALGEHT